MNIYKGQVIKEQIINSIISVLNSMSEFDNANAYYKHTEYSDVNCCEKRYVELFVTSPNIGVLLFRSIEMVESSAKKLRDDYLEQTADDCVHLQKIISQSRQLRNGFSGIKIPLYGFLVSNVELENIEGFEIHITTLENLSSHIKGLLAQCSVIKDEDYSELIAIVEGSKVLQPNKSRLDSGKSGLAREAEKSIALFGREQRDFIYSYPINGFQILRGLAGSGKTVLLSRKAAELHKNDPDATIIYTFYTKSLYQTVRNYIRSFYACLSPDNPEPNWEKLRILHAWGGTNVTGVYYEACQNSNSKYLSFGQALQKNFSEKPFDIACKDLLYQIKNKTVEYFCDYSLIDEGQDFPVSFVQMCVRFTKGGKVIWAYDDLQTIFQDNNPSAQAEKIGIDISYTKNLKICYRNPNEILICAHALGFGLYGEIIQTFESKTDWENLGYSVTGDFLPDSKVTLTRPQENVHHIWKNNPDISEIIDIKILDSVEEETEELVRHIKADIDSGLNPEDILIICLNDHDAKNNASLIEEKLSAVSIRANNLQSDMLNLYDFVTKDEVTISTVHKAKGNEAFQVYIIGIEAILSNESNKFKTIRSRNMLYTAMTRSKGCLMLFGVGEHASKLKVELDQAKAHYPNIEFRYPKQDELRLIKNNIKIAQAPDELLTSVKTLRNILGKEAFEQFFENIKNEG